MKMTYKQAWTHIFDKLLTDEQRIAVYASSNSHASAALAMAAERLADASGAAQGQAECRETRLLQQLMTENPL